MLQVIFSDESTIAVLDDRVHTVCRRSGEEFLLQYLKKTVKCPAKIMVWGSISVHETSRLHIVEGTINQVKYLLKLEGRLLGQVREWFPDNDFIFQHGIAPCHTGKISMKWLRQQN